eukprot:s3429_g8.t1
MVADVTPTMSFSGPLNSINSFRTTGPLSNPNSRKLDQARVRHQAELMGITPGTSLLAQQTGHPRWISEGEASDGEGAEETEEVEIEVEVEEEADEESPTPLEDAASTSGQPFIVRRRAEIALRDLACKAICRIKKGIRKPGAQSDGRPFIPEDWDELFKPHLGSYIAFLLSRPDQFRVVQGVGPGRYTVEDVTGDETVVAPSPEELANKGTKGGLDRKGKGKFADAGKGRKGIYKGRGKTQLEDVGKGSQKSKGGSTVLAAKSTGSYTCVFGCKQFCYNTGLQGARCQPVTPTQGARRAMARESESHNEPALEAKQPKLAKAQEERQDPRLFKQPSHHGPSWRRTRSSTPSRSPWMWSEALSLPLQDSSSEAEDPEAFCQRSAWLPLLGRDAQSGRLASAIPNMSLACPRT